MPERTVTVRMLGILVTVLIAVFGYVFMSIGQTNTRIDTYSVSMTKIQVQLSQIQADLVWIKGKF